jgi:GDP-L-fucose synthase
MNYLSGKKILVTGGTGLIGMALLKKLKDAKPKLIKVVSLDKPINIDDDFEFENADLREFSNCLRVTKNIDVVFNLVGVKGSPQMSKFKPASFFVPTLTFNTNMMEASKRNNVDRYLFTSSVGVYAPAKIFLEDDVWKTFPSENDRFAGWAKRMGELQSEAYKIENNWKGISIVRPANVYGPFDNFDPKNAMVIPSLICRAASGENPLKIQGNGLAIRDFIFADDVVDGMILAIEKNFSEPLNLGSGIGYSIKELAKYITNNFEGLEFQWANEKGLGDDVRIMDITRAKKIGYSPKISLEDGIKITCEWFKKNKDKYLQRYNSFLEKK